MGPFATVDDYIARYGEPEDPTRVAVLLGDASAFIASQPGFPEGEPSELLSLSLAVVTCSVVHRSLSAGAWSGFSSVSQGAGGQTASVTLSNPSGDFYLTKQERRMLGLGGGRVGQTDPFGEAADA